MTAARLLASPRVRRLLPLAALSACGAGAVLVLQRVDPNAPGSLLPPCPIHALTGIYCPGCGSTRALHALVHGDLPHAMAMNPLLVVSLPAIGLMALSAAGLLPRRMDPLMRVLGNPRLWLVLLTAFSVLRNLPWMPFRLLAPG